MSKKKYKHGRVGVKDYKPKRPLSEDQKAQAYEKGWREGYREGVVSSLNEAVNVTKGARTIRDARRKIQELVDGKT